MASRKLTRHSLPDMTDRAWKVIQPWDDLCKSKILYLEERAQAARGLVALRTERRHELYQRKIGVGAEIGGLERQEVEYGLTPRDREQLALLRRQYDEIRDEMLQEQGRTLNGGSLAHIIEAIEKLKGSFVHCPVTVDDKTPPHEGLSKAQAATDAVRVELKRVKNSQRSLAEADAQIESDVSEMAEGGKPNVRRVLLRNTAESTTREIPGKTVFPEESLTGLDVLVRAEMGVSFVCWALRDQVIAACKAELRKHFKPNSAMTAAERTKKLATLEAKLLEAERIEEAWIMRCEAIGLQVTRRGGNVLATLEIAPA